MSEEENEDLGSKETEERKWNEKKRREREGENTRKKRETWRGYQ